jgi:hypothetical protein
MRLSILIPFRDADGTRTRAKEWIVRRWAHFWPEAEIIEASDDGLDPFNKSLAVNKAAAQATGDVLAIVDADTWIDPQWIERGLDAIEYKRKPWVIPAHSALRLKQDVSEKLMALDPTGPLPPIGIRDAESGRAIVVGFLWMVPRSHFHGMDERIRGWGGEDTMFTQSMNVMHGVPRRFSGTLICLWHPRPRDNRGQRIWPGQDRAAERELKAGLAKQYRAARTPSSMLTLVQAGVSAYEEAA